MAVLFLLPLWHLPSKSLPVFCFIFGLLFSLFSSCRIGHENFELLNHDVVEPLLLEGE